MQPPGTAGHPRKAPYPKPPWKPAPLPPRRIPGQALRSSPSAAAGSPSSLPPPAHGTWQPPKPHKSSHGKKTPPTATSPRQATPAPLPQWQKNPPPQTGTPAPAQTPSVSIPTARLAWNHKASPRPQICPPSQAFSPVPSPQYGSAGDSGPAPASPPISRSGSPHKTAINHVPARPNRQTAPWPHISSRKSSPSKAGAAGALPPPRLIPQSAPPPLSWTGFPLPPHSPPASPSTAPRNWDSPSR